MYKVEFHLVTTSCFRSNDISKNGSPRLDVLHLLVDVGVIMAKGRQRLMCG